MLKRIIFSSLLVATLLYSESINFKNRDLNRWSRYGTWKVTVDGLSMVKRSDRDFNLCYSKDINFTDGNISVDFRANSGKIDQGGGIMWRVEDNNNYYVARFNPLEDNFRFYIVHNGIRTQLASADIKLASGWHNMKIEQREDIFKGYIDGKEYLKHKDSQIKRAGGVGLWTKADAKTSFKNFKIDKIE